MWFDIIDTYYPGGRMVNISPHHRVIHHGDKAIKIQHGSADSHIEQTQSVEAEYEILNRLNGAAGPLQPHLKLLRTDWAALELNWIEGRLLIDILNDPDSAKPSIRQLLATAFRVARRGVAYSQFRGRHIIVRPSGEMVFIDFGGSHKSSALRTLLQVFSPIARRNARWHVSQLWYLAKKIHEHGRAASNADERSAPTLARWSFAEQAAGIGFDPDADEARHLFSAEADIKLALTQNPNVAHDIPTVFIGPFYMRGSEHWELLWHTVTSAVPTRGRNVTVLQAGIGLAAIFAAADGAAKVIACEEDATLTRAAVRISQAFGVQSPNFVSAPPDGDADLVILLSRRSAPALQRVHLERFAAARDMVIRTTLQDSEIEELLAHDRTFNMLRQDGDWRLLHIHNPQTESRK